jgi:hypothetical protein
MREMGRTWNEISRWPTNGTAGEDSLVPYAPQGARINIMY